MPYELIQVSMLNRIRSKIQSAIYTPVSRLSVCAWITKEPVSFQHRMTGQRIELQPGDKWGELWDCAWFHFQGKVPHSAIGNKVVLLIDVNGELCLVDEEGTPVQGLTNVNSEFDKSLGLPGKRVVLVSDPATGHETIDLWGDAGCNDLFGVFRGGTLKEAQIAICHEETRQLYYDFEVLLELAEQMEEQSARRHRILHVLYQVSLLLTEMTTGNIAKARTILAVELDKRGGDPTLTISAVGHAHIDLAWLWPIRETVRKGARTFSTALRMMELYPDYVFGASQPQLYQWVKESYPKLYQKVKERIYEGRWEPQGAMWVEPDSNISGGEALIRQILYGKRFFWQEFQQEMKILWVPDIFGYAASLPQILKKSGVDYMMTQKLSWNTYNDHPHHTFLWEGIDGSRVLTHMPPEDTYNSPAAPRSIAKAERDYHDKNISDHCLLLYGIGDGGGGPGEEHLERLQREKNLQGLAPVIQEPAIHFFRKLAEKSDQFKIWRGELYLEKHQGTLTSQARSKKYNRKMEKALRELEFASVFQLVLGGNHYPSEELQSIWKETLLYQFHDILPGSSITRVYDESLKRYEELLGRVEEMISGLYQNIAQQVRTEGFNQPLIIFNSLPWERKEWMLLKEKWVYATVPPMGYQAIDIHPRPDSETFNLIAESNCIENELLRVTFNPDGTIDSIFDKEYHREITASNGKANQLTIYQDNGDAWDFPSTYVETQGTQMHLHDVQSQLLGPQAIREQVYQYGQSKLTQKIVLTVGSRKIDFQTRVDWQESGKMLRTSFPVDIYTEHVNCEIQFGYVKRPTHRNTLWDFAKEEICAHHWIDLSQPDYGVTLVNDCKYGHRAHGNVMDINLLRSPSYPDPQADRTLHEFTYSLYPHAGDFIQAEVYKKGYELNIPLRTIQPLQQTGELSSSEKLIQLDSNKVMIEAVKKAEDDDSIIIRLYEATGSSVCSTINIEFSYQAAELVDLMENSQKLLLSSGASKFKLNFDPFEIKTIKVSR